MSPGTSSRGSLPKAKSIELGLAHAGRESLDKENFVVGSRSLVRGGPLYLPI